MNKALTKYDKSTNTLFINTPEDGLKVVVNGDLSLKLNGEISCVTYDNNICFDTIKGRFFINSRQGKDIKHLPESIEYRQKILDEIKRMDKKNKHKHLETCPLREKILKLEDKVRLLEKKCQE